LILILSSFSVIVQQQIYDLLTYSLLGAESFLSS
jgi:hypothetical protein